MLQTCVITRVPDVQTFLMSNGECHITNPYFSLPSPPLTGTITGAQKAASLGVRDTVVFSTLENDTSTASKANDTCFASFAAFLVIG